MKEPYQQLLRYKFLEVCLSRLQCSAFSTPSLHLHFVKFQTIAMQVLASCQLNFSGAVEISLVCLLLFRFVCAIHSFFPDFHIFAVAALPKLEILPHYTLHCAHLFCIAKLERQMAN